MSTTLKLSSESLKKEMSPCSRDSWKWLESSPATVCRQPDAPLYPSCPDMMYDTWELPPAVAECGAMLLIRTWALGDLVIVKVHSLHVRPARGGTSSTR